MSNSVNVLCRIKPINEMECISIYQENCILLGNRPFTFDKVYKSNCKNDYLFENACLPLLKQFVNGYNCTMLAYGQTGSGKTYSMGTDVNYSDGIIPNAVKWLFDSVNNINGTITVSFLELYNEEFIDLLKLENQPKLREVDSQIVWSNVHQEQCHSFPEALECLYKGSANRKTGSTDMNATSSRSHAIFSIELKTNDISSKFCFVDLAGSERLKRTNAIGIRQKEGISINSGLLALGNVIYALSVQSMHIPYRDSKLTRMLQDSLGGNAYTTMIACISPHDSDFQETLNTLKYASRAREIQNQAVRNLLDSGDDIVKLKELVRQLRMENEELKNSKHYHPQYDSIIKENKDLKIELELHKCKYDDLHTQYQLNTINKYNIDHSSSVITQTHHEKVYTTIIEQLRKRLKRFQKLFQPRVRHSWHSVVTKETEWEDIDEADHSADSNESSLLDEDQLNDALSEIQGNIQEQEQIVQQLEVSQSQYQALKTMYEQKMNDLQKKCQEISQERDKFLKYSSDINQVHHIKNKYELKLSKIQQKLIDLRIKHHSTENALSDIRDKTKQDIISMKGSITDLRKEKAKLMQQVKHENVKARRQTIKSEREVFKLKKKELKSSILIQKYERHLELQVFLHLFRSSY